MCARKSVSDSEIVIVGLARNCEHVIEAEITKISSAFSIFKCVYWIIIESDSDDKTVSILKKVSSRRDINFISLGKLNILFPKRTERIAYCRNYYLSIIKENAKYKNTDYVVVVDLDGVNKLIDQDSVESCWRVNIDWDGCFANQSAPYYDIWALRHPLWMPNDCWEVVRFLKNLDVNSVFAADGAVYSRMIKILPESEPIQVVSAFGGMAIYKKEYFLKGYYKGVDLEGNPICEHVHFNKLLVESGAKLFIIPSLINSGWNEHNGNMKLFRIVKRYVAVVYCRLVSNFRIK